MHDLILQGVIEACRKREQEGDCPVTPAQSVETLENAVVQMADICSEVQKRIKHMKSMQGKRGFDRPTGMTGYDWGDKGDYDDAWKKLDEALQMTEKFGR